MFVYVNTFSYLCSIKSNIAIITKNGRPPRQRVSSSMKMYFFNKREQNGWEHEYKYFECDADAMMYARTLLGATCIMVAVYRHEDHDTCGIKQFVAAYDR